LLGQSRATGRETQAELATDLFLQAPRRQVFLHGLPRLGPESLLVEARRLLQQRVEPLLLLPLGIRLRRRLLVLELDGEPVGEPLDGAHEVEALRLPNERDRVPTRLAAEAVVRPALRRDRERRRLLLVERAQPRVARAHFSQPRAGLDEDDDVRGGLDRF